MLKVPTLINHMIGSSGNQPPPPKLSIGHSVSLSSGVAERGLLETPKVTPIIKEISGVVEVFWGTKTNYILLTL